MLSMKINCFHEMIKLSEGCPWKWASVCRPSLWYSYERVMYDNKLPDLAQTCGICVRKSPMKINHLTSALCVSVDTMQLLTFVEVNIRIYPSKAEAEVNIIHLEKIYPFSFEFKGNSLSDTRCMIQDVVIKEWRDVVRDLLCRTILSWRHFIGMRGENFNVSNVSKAKEWIAKITWRHAQNVVSTRVL